MNLPWGTQTLSTEGGLGLTQGFVVSFQVNFTARWTILLLLPCPASHKMLVEVLKRYTQSPCVRPSAHHCTRQLVDLFLLAISGWRICKIRAAGNSIDLMRARLARVNNPFGYPNEHIQSLTSNQPELFSINFAGNVKNHKIQVNNPSKQN